MIAIGAEPIRIVYFGTPSYALPCLHALHRDPRVHLALVVTQPDRPAGRGHRLAPPPVKVEAIDLGLSTYQPATLRTREDRAPIAAARADLFIVAAFGTIFGPKLLQLPTFGCVNLHASLLPAYRGASPVSAAILEGQQRTGVTLMRMDAGLDTGPILAQQSLDILPTDTTLSLTHRLGELGATLMIDALDPLAAGAMQPIPQNDSLATITRPMVKADGWIEWSRTSHDIERQVRAMWDWPRAWTTFRGTTIQIHAAATSDFEAAVPPGVLVSTPEGAAVACGSGCLVLRTVQTAGAGPIAGDTWMRQTAAPEELLGAEGAPLPLPSPLVCEANR